MTGLCGAAFGLTPEWLLAQYQVIYPSTLLLLWDPTQGVYSGSPRQLDSSKCLFGPDFVSGGPHKWYQEELHGRMAINAWPAADFGAAKEVTLDATCSAPIISALAVTKLTTLTGRMMIYPQINTQWIYSPNPGYGDFTLSATAPGARTFAHYVNGVSTDTIQLEGYNILEGIDTTPATATTLLRVGTYPGYNNVGRSWLGVIRALSATPTAQQRSDEIALLSRYYRRSFP